MLVRQTGFTEYLQFDFSFFREGASALDKILRWHWEMCWEIYRNLSAAYKTQTSQLNWSKTAGLDKFTLLIGAEFLLLSCPHLCTPSRCLLPLYHPSTCQTLPGGQWHTWLSRKILFVLWRFILAIKMKWIKENKSRGMDAGSNGAIPSLQSLTK